MSLIASTKFQSTHEVMVYKQREIFGISILKFSILASFLPKRSTERGGKLMTVTWIREWSLNHGFLSKHQEAVSTKVAFISALANGNTIRVFKVQKKHDGTGNTVTGEFDFPQQHKADIINVGVSANGKFIMSCSNDTTIVIWNLKGEVLETLNTNQVNNSFACISPCGRFVASAGFTSDVKLYEVEFSKNGEFKQVSRAMDLKGHSAGVYHFSFSSDCTRVATVSKDGTWKIWNIDVEYKKGQDPALLMTGVYSDHHNNMFIAISPDSYVVAISMGRSIGVFNTTTGELEELLENVHSDDITSLTWHPSSHFFASAGGTDKHIRVWHNTAGIKAHIHDLEDQLKKAKTESHKTRLEHRILEARSTLEKISL